MSHAPRLRLALALSAVVAAAAAVGASPGQAATAQSSLAVPSAPGQRAVTWDATAPFANNTGGIAVDDPTGSCDPSNTTLNSQHTVAVTFPPKLDPKLDTLVRFSIRWNATVKEPTDDLALHVFGPDGKLVASSDGSQLSEGINVTDRTGGTYNVLVCAFQNTPKGTPYVGTATAYVVTPALFPKAKGVVAPTYRQYTAPKTESTNAGEPSIGNNWKTGNTLFTSNTDEYVVAFDDRKGTSTWTVVNTDITDPSNKISLDPIGFTDHVTGRTVVSQLYLACSASAYTDDDFQTTAVPAEGCGSGVNGFDHQTFGGGPYPKEAPNPLAGALYPHAVYYCAQGQGLVLGGATCARSDDGSLTFNNPVATWDAECTGIHGHVQVGPSDGAVYLPNAKCGDKQGVAVSLDAGQTWAVRTIPDSLSGESDPYVGVGSDGTVYYSYSDGTGHPRVAVSRDHGLTWSKSVDLGVPFGVRNSEFAMVVAGDGDRASVAFLGTTTPGSTQAASFGKNAERDTFVGAAWHMYLSTTYDRGKTWTTVDATPKDPVQRGCIWNSGGGNPCRNLLDFNGMTIDKTGRVMVGFADGCVGPETESGNDCVASTAVSANKLVNHGAIIRQTSGKTLFKAFDTTTPVARPVTPAVPTVPTVPTVPSTPSAGGAPLAATGGAPLAALGGLLLLLAGFAVRRQRA